MKAGAGMSTDEKISVPVATFGVSEPSDSKQAKWYSKRMVHVAAVISGVSLLVIIAVVTGFVVMAKEHQKSTRRIIESSYTLSSGNEMKNHKEVIPDENVEIDTMTKPDGSIQVIVTDFNRRIQIKEDSQRCLVFSMIDWDNEDAKAGQKYMVVDEKPVRDDSFLTASARDLCKHKTIFWAHPGCLNTDPLPSGEGEREKRQALEVFVNSLAAQGNGTGVSCCGVGVPYCCAVCEEGTISPLSTTTFGLTSWFGTYEICSGSLIDGNNVWCIWFVFGRFGRPIYEFTCQL